VANILFRIPFLHVSGLKHRDRQISNFPCCSTEPSSHAFLPNCFLCYVHLRHILKVNWFLKHTNWNAVFSILIPPHGVTAPIGPSCPHHLRFAITLRHTKLCRTPLDEWSACRRDLYLTTHNTHKRQTSRVIGGIRTRNPSKRATADLRLLPSGHRDRPCSYHKEYVRYRSRYVGFIGLASWWMIRLLTTEIISKERTK